MKSKAHSGRNGRSSLPRVPDIDELGIDGAIIAEEPSEPEYTPEESAYALLAAGHSDISAQRHLCSGHHLTPAQARTAIEAAYAQMQGALERPLMQRMALALEQRSRIAASATDAGDLRIALAALEQRDKLQGLSGPEALGASEAMESILHLVQLASSSNNLTGKVRAHTGDRDARD